MMEAVYPTLAQRGPSTGGEAATDPLVYSRWACEECRRYHFPDGTLYTNPFADKGDADT